jgi:hypothetical protein
MNVFEDLVVELQEEQLLEKTIIDLDNERNTDPGPLDDLHALGSSFELTSPETEITERVAAAADVEASVTSTQETEVELDDLTPSAGYDDVDSEGPAGEKASKSEKEFFKKRAVTEVSSLQMVEHVLTAVEREYMKIVPAGFDDINAKKALHAFLNIAYEPSSDEYNETAAALLRETERWGMALTDRDRNIAVANLRRYCENSRPALSSQALLALARFYRNSPYSEGVRAKFDFVMTRLFSRPAQNEKRLCLFDRSETVGHINTLYGDWSSVPLYSADDDESNVVLTSMSFDELAAEAEASPSFDQLISTDFFGRVRLFKESISELFFAPSVAAAAIESNIRIGNAYVTLLEREHRKMDADSIESKYSDLDLQTVSDTTGRTLDLAELMRLRALEGDVDLDDGDGQADEASEDKIILTTSNVPDPEAPTSAAQRFIESTRKVNRWLIMTAGLLVIVTIGLYVWADFLAEEKISTVGVQAVQLEGTPLGEYIKTGKVSGDTFYGLLLPTWDNLPKDKREEFIQKVYEAGKDQGYKQVNLINKDGRPAGFASASRVEVDMP